MKQSGHVSVQGKAKSKLPEVYINYKGCKINSWTIVEYSKSIKSKSRYRLWVCKCDCGREKEVNIKMVLIGKSKSCGIGECNHRFKTKQSREDYAIKQRYSLYKTSAIRRERVFELSLEEFNLMIKSNCSYCGCLPMKSRQRCGKNYFYVEMNGIDRADNNEGYTKANSVPCCRMCNRAKMDYGLDEFKEWVSRLYIHMHEKTH